jgi:hypothetical protein
VSGKDGELKVRFNTRTAASANTLRGYILWAIEYGFGGIPVWSASKPACRKLEPGDHTW